ncbi:Putative protein in type-1 retrotransposable element R1DM [Araneus ventricosus]|uniref:Retrovirus-related Pol polyprotein from type-1 retrotransposable element R1 n=1 Tax=Araneus ventricosus TaxID=182803 RepID=A0A4Y2HAX8_ARAVE|nr:Putative protein in type-1 retrotransposable element R1DM [Araneus ventricosus]
MAAKQNRLMKQLPLLFKNFSPRDSVNSETLKQTQTRVLVNGYNTQIKDKNFSKQEIREVIGSMAKRKAPGLDNISVQMMEIMHKKNPVILTGIFNKCLELGIFPTEWKKARLVLLGKPGKDPELANSYRPICLLSVISKILDKLITQRIIYLLKSKGMLKSNQHGFSTGKSCETANFELKQSIQRAMKNKNKVCLLSLDVAGAFDNAWRTSILEQLVKANCPINLFNLIKNYLHDRQVIFELNNKKWVFEAQRGVPQGSCSGPLFWNIVVSTALGLVLPSGCQIQAFADDLILVVRGQSANILAQRCNKAIDILVSWGKKHKLQFNATKTILMPLSFGGRLNRNEPLQVTMEGHPVSIRDQLVYLGVTWDSTLTFTPHFKNVRRKADLLTYKISSIAEKFYWRHNKMFKRIYIGAIEPFMIYGHGAWGHRLHLKTVSRFLNGIQRRPLIKVTRAFRTTSTDALQVIAGIMPLALRAKEVYSKFLVLTIKINTMIEAKEFCWDEFESKEDIYNRHPADWISILFGIEDPVGDEIEIFTDGSGIDGKVGAAMVVYYHGTEIHSEICRLQDTATVFQAETKGIHTALEFIKVSKNWHKFHIFSDSKSVLQSLSCAKNTRQSILELKDLFVLAARGKWIRLHWVKAHVGVTGNERADSLSKSATERVVVDFKCLSSKATLGRSIRSELINVWQEKWERSRNGRHTFKYFPKVGLKVNSYSPKVTQFITAHGRFPEYFFKFHLPGDCYCCCGCFGSVEHYLDECQYTKNIGQKLNYDKEDPPSLFYNKKNMLFLQQLIEKVDSIVPQTN